MERAELVATGGSAPPLHVLSLVHVISDGYTVANAPSPILPAVTLAAALHVSLVIPVLPVSTTACSLARLPSGTSSTSIPLNERQYRSPIWLGGFLGTLLFSRSCTSSL